MYDFLINYGLVTIKLIMAIGVAVIYLRFFNAAAQIEPNGDLTIVRKGAKKYSVVIIDNGDVDADALVEIGRGEKWLMRELKKKKIKNMDEVLLAQWHNNRLQIIKKEG